jgi:hypothetical protein
MTLFESYVIFPDGERREINHLLKAGDLVDINGNPLDLPIPTNRMIAYHVAGRRTNEERGVITTTFILEQLNSDELLAYT